MRQKLERFEMFAYDALQNDGWDDIEVDYYHEDIYPHEIYGVPITLIKRGLDEDGESCEDYQLLISGFCHGDGYHDEIYHVKLINVRDDYRYVYEKTFLYSFYEFKECYKEALVIVKKDKLTERALEIGNGKVYAVQDALFTRKTHDNTGEKDFIVKNGKKDLNLTNSEKDVAKKSIEVLKQMGKLSDVSKEYNVDHGPDLTYIPIEDTVRVIPDDGSKPYKIKIPEALSFLKPYEYDILDEAVAVYTKADKCKKALQENFSAIETVSPADNKSFGYLENEVVIFKLK